MVEQANFKMISKPVTATTRKLKVKGTTEFDIYSYPILTNLERLLSGKDFYGTK